MPTLDDFSEILRLDEPLAPLLMAGTLLIMRRADPHAAPAAALSPSKLPGQS